MPAYPKDYFEQVRPQIEVDVWLCFMLMPFQPAFNSVWDIVKTTIESDPLSARCLRADDISKPGSIMENVLENVSRANIILAELTGQNPNVFYELGIAHTFKASSQVLLLAQSIDFIPFDLRHLRILIYKPDLSDLRDKLTEALSEILPRRYRLVLHATERKTFPARVSGIDHCHYEIQLEVPGPVFLTDDSVKFFLRCTRFVVGEDPKVVYESGEQLGSGCKSLEIPNLDWNLRREGGDRTKAIIVLERKR